MRRYQERVDAALTQFLPSTKLTPTQLHDAMHYAVLGGGKRIRPILVYTTAQCLGADLVEVDAAACAVELIHCYSLVHDDLPVMDDDDLRRGRPTCHKVYGDAMALLAGDALQCFAIEILSHGNLHPESTLNNEQALSRLKMIAALSSASGSTGMAGGQAIDLAAVGKHLTIEQLEQMHRLKTGALIEASVVVGALAANCDETTMTQLKKYAQCIGLAFQIRDDLLDIESDTETLGKPQGSDQEQDKPTYPSLLGLKGARDMAQQMHNQALDALAPLGDSVDPLRWLSSYIVQRCH
ncbi:MAG: polyprenyl synthetase family protein [Gammaproteobacteria bacterium]|nr:polyprenyl synthetase family protein [Gammaproteobacteria bacterium]